MAEFVLKNVKILFGGVDLSGDMNEVNVTRSADMLDKTAFGSSGRRRLAGLKDFQVTGGGFFDAASTQKNDPHLFSKLGTTGGVLTIAQNTSKGAIAYAAEEIESEYSPAGRIGEMMRFNFACYGDGDAVRGVIAEGGTGLSTALSATPQNLGAVSTTKRLYAFIQVRGISSSGGTHRMRVRIQSDNSSAFGSPTTVINMSPILWANRVSAEMKSTAPGTTDNWFRVRMDSTGSTNSKMTGFIGLAVQ